MHDDLTEKPLAWSLINEKSARSYDTKPPYRLPRPINEATFRYLYRSLSADFLFTCTIFYSYVYLIDPLLLFSFSCCSTEMYLKLEPYAISRWIHFILQRKCK